MQKFSSICGSSLASGLVEMKGLSGLYLSSFFLELCFNLYETEILLHDPRFRLLQQNYTKLHHSLVSTTTLEELLENTLQLTSLKKSLQLEHEFFDSDQGSSSQYVDESQLLKTRTEFSSLCDLHYSLVRRALKIA